MDIKCYIMWILIILVSCLGIFSWHLILYKQNAEDEYSTICVNSVSYITTGHGITVAYSPTGKILTCDNEDY